jgi:hypothetical protein
MIHKSFALFQIVSYNTMDLSQLLYVGRAMEQPLLLLTQGLLLVIPTISVVSVLSTLSEISLISCVDPLIILLLLRGPLAMWFKEPRSGLRGLNAYISDYK